MFFNYCLASVLCSFVFTWDMTIWRWISLFNFYLFKYLIYYPIGIAISISKNNCNVSKFFFQQPIGLSGWDMLYQLKLSGSLSSMILAWKTHNVNKHLLFSPLLSTSQVNWIFLWKLSNTDIMHSINPMLTEKIVSSTYSGLVVKVLDSQSRGPMFKTTGWLQSRLSLSSFQGRSNEYQEFLETKW